MMSSLVTTVKQPSRREASPVSKFRNNNHPIPIEKIPPVSTRGQGLPFCLPALQGWMADQAMPDHGLQSLGQGCYPARIDLRNEHDHIAVLGGISAVPADDPNTFAERALTKSIAWTMLALMLRSASPPPTE
jgi:hypothetical protein